MTIGKKIRQARKERGLSQAELARAIGLRSQSVISELEADRLDTWSKHGKALARALGRDEAWFEADTESPSDARSSALHPVTRFVPVMGEVQAGVWSELVADDEELPKETLPVHLPSFEGATLFALTVRGNSMNVRYPDGTRVIVCPVVEVGAKSGNDVVIRRRCSLGIETTVKEAVKVGDRVEFWPRSTDPAFQEPIVYTGSEAEALEIVAVVVASYSVAKATTGPLIKL